MSHNSPLVWIIIVIVILFVLYKIYQYTQMEGYTIVDIYDPQTLYIGGIAEEPLDGLSGIIDYDIERAEVVQGANAVINANDSARWKQIQEAIEEELEELHTDPHHENPAPVNFGEEGEVGYAGNYETMNGSIGKVPPSTVVSLGITKPGAIISVDGVQHPMRFPNRFNRYRFGHGDRRTRCRNIVTAIRDLYARRIISYNEARNAFNRIKGICGY